MLALTPRHASAPVWQAVLLRLNDWAPQARTAAWQAFERLLPTLDLNTARQLQDSLAALARGRRACHGDALERVRQCLRTLGQMPVSLHTDTDADASASVDANITADEADQRYLSDALLPLHALPWLGTDWVLCLAFHSIPGCVSGCFLLACVVPSVQTGSGPVRGMQSLCRAVAMQSIMQP